MAKKKKANAFYDVEKAKAEAKAKSTSAHKNAPTKASVKDLKKKPIKEPVRAESMEIGKTDLEKPKDFDKVQGIGSHKEESVERKNFDKVNGKNTLKESTFKTSDDKKQGKENTEKESALNKLLHKFKISVKRAVKRAILSISSTIAISVLALVALLIVVSMIIGIIGSLLAAILSVLLGTTGGTGNLGDLNLGTPVTQVAGAKYQWNMVDCDKLGDPYLQNIYLHAWLFSNIKDITGVSLYTTTVLGIPTFENGCTYFSTYDIGPELEKGWLISEYASGATVYAKEYIRDADGEIIEVLDDPENTVYQGMYQHWMYYEDTTIGEQMKSVMGKYYTDNAEIWKGILPEGTSLKTDALTADGTEYRLGFIDKYSGGDVMFSTYNLGALMLLMADNFKSTDTLTTNSDAYLHHYGDAYLKAVERYGIEDNEVSRAYARSSVFYMQHGGGIWGACSTKEDWTILRNAMMDYIMYCYSRHPDLRLTDDYATPITSLGGTGIRKNTMGDLNYNFAGEGAYKSWYSGSTTVLTPVLTNGVDGEKISEAIMGTWAKGNTTSGDDYAKYNTYITTIMNGDNLAYRQGIYTVANGVGTHAAGAAKLDAVFDKLGIEWVLDFETGYICLPSGAGYVAEGHYDFTGKPFELIATWYTTDNPNNVGSRNRDNSWFAKINTSEWANPLDVNPDAKTGGVKITSRYGFRALGSGYDWHNGMDIVYGATLSTDEYPVYAMHDGVLTYYNIDLPNTGGCGRNLTYKVEYERNGTIVTRYITYMHLSSISERITSQVAAQSIGESIEIKKGELLGTMGGSGNEENSYGVHLHLQIGKIPKANGPIGILDTETELPFLTLYPNYYDVDDGWLKFRPKVDGVSTDTYDGTNVDANNINSFDETVYS